MTNISSQLTGDIHPNCTNSSFGLILCPPPQDCPWADTAPYNTSLCVLVTQSRLTLCDPIN